MPKTKRKFIDKKNAVTFHLVHRSQKDPLITDETAPQHVLLESKATPNAKEITDDRSKRKAEERKYGVFFDDEYDYLQHLRTREDTDAVHWEYLAPANLKGKEAANDFDLDTMRFEAKPESANALNLPSSVFATEFEEDEGLLRKAAPRPGPRPDLEPEIVAALDDDFDFADPDNQLEDNFMEMAMGGEGDAVGELDGEYSDIGSDFDDDDFDVSGDDEDEMADRLGPLRQSRFDDEETKSRFTEYSMSSSVMRRNEQLSLLDDRFEKFFENYDEPEIGALDCEEIEGNVELSGDLLAQCMVELKRDGDDLPYDRKWDQQRLAKLLDGESSEEELVELEVTDEGVDKKWDCESVLSMSSNLYNHPKMIAEPRRRKTSKIVIDAKSGVPRNVLHGDNQSLTAKSIAKLNTDIVAADSNGAGPKSLCGQSVLSAMSVLSIRPKDETIEEKRQRKRLLKEYRAERRIERKANQDAFKDEKKRQTQISINNRNNIQGNRIL